MSMKDDVLDMKRELQEVKEQSFAMELLKDAQRTNKRQFIIILVLIFSLVAETIFMFYTLNDIGTIEETNTQEVEDIETVNGSIINKGDIYGEDKTHEQNKN